MNVVVVSWDESEEATDPNVSVYENRILAYRAITQFAIDSPFVQEIEHMISEGGDFFGSFYSDEDQAFLRVWCFDLHVSQAQAIGPKEAYV
jgi:hypothetical protein